MHCGKRRWGDVVCYVREVSNLNSNKSIYMGRSSRESPPWQLLQNQNGRSTSAFSRSYLCTLHLIPFQPSYKAVFPCALLSLSCISFPVLFSPSHQHFKDPQVFSFSKENKTEPTHTKTWSLNHTACQLPVCFLSLHSHTL